MSPKTIWLYGIIVLALITGTYTITSKIYKSGYKSGVDTTTIDFNSRITAMELLHTETTDKLKQTNQILANQIRDDIGKIDRDYIITLEQQNAKMQDTLNGISDGTLRLYDHGASETSTDTAGTDSTTTCPVGNHDKKDSGLSKETSRFLVSITNEADRNTEQLTACQNLVKTYLDVIEQYNQSLSQGRSGLRVTGNQD